MTDFAPVALGLEVPFGSFQSSLSTVAVDFLTPTLLVERNRNLVVPTLTGLINGVRRRISMLCDLYERTAWEADAGAISSAAKLATTVDWQSHSKTPYRRTSTRTGQQMPMDGFLGTVVFDGVDPRLWPLLLMGQEVHAGSHTVWGHGWFRARLG